MVIEPNLTDKHAGRIRACHAEPAAKHGPSQAVTGFTGHGGGMTSEADTPLSVAGNINTERLSRLEDPTLHGKAGADRRARPFTVSSRGSGIAHQSASLTALGKCVVIRRCAYQSAGFAPASIETADHICRPRKLSALTASSAATTSTTGAAAGLAAPRSATHRSGLTAPRHGPRRHRTQEAAVRYGTPETLRQPNRQRR